jgi:hypothetical protein
MVVNRAVLEVAVEASRRRIDLPGIPPGSRLDRYLSPLSVAQFGPAMAAQGDDLARGLLLFAEGKPATFEDGSGGWLGVHLSASIGNEAEDEPEHIGLVMARADDWRRIAVDPLGNLEWAAAPRPWSALAAILEFVAILDHPTDRPFVSHLPVALDAATVCRSACTELAEEPSRPAYYAAVAAAAAHGVSLVSFGPEILATHAADVWLASFLAVDAFTRLKRFDESEVRRKEREALQEARRRRRVGGHLRLLS